MHCRNQKVRNCLLIKPPPYAWRQIWVPHFEFCSPVMRWQLLLVKNFGLKRRFKLLEACIPASRLNRQALALCLATCVTIHEIRPYLARAQICHDRELLRSMWVGRWSALTSLRSCSVRAFYRPRDMSPTINSKSIAYSFTATTSLGSKTKAMINNDQHIRSAFARSRRSSINYPDRATSSFPTSCWWASLMYRRFDASHDDRPELNEQSKNTYHYLLSSGCRLKATSMRYHRIRSY